MLTEANDMRIVKSQSEEGQSNLFWDADSDCDGNAAIMRGAEINWRVASSGLSKGFRTSLCSIRATHWHSMKTILVGIGLCTAIGVLGPAHTQAQTTQTATIAYDIPAGTKGNQADKGLWVGNDFYVVRPITVWHLGVFDHKSDGIQGGAVLTAQLFARTGDEGTLLETVSFDATSPGELRGGQRFKALAQPLTLLPGAYTILAGGFDALNPEGNAGNGPYARTPVPWSVNDGGGLVRFEGGGRFGYVGANQFPNYRDGGPVNRYAAGTFTFTAAALPASPWTSDYAALTKGVANFPAECCLGSLAVFGRTAFPVIAEPGGRRLTVAAAGIYQGTPGGARCVAFAHTQFGYATNDARLTLFDNAILWAGRKPSRPETVVGVGPGLDLKQMAELGYAVKAVSTNMATAETDLSGCDVFVLDWHGGDTNDAAQAGFTAEAVAQMAVFNAQGGGLVMVATPWAISYMWERPAFAAANFLLNPFGLAYRDSQTGPMDWGFTNIAPQPWPAHFSAFPAADLLRLDREKKITLSGFDKMVALGAINQTLSARPDLLCDLTSTCAGDSVNVAGEVTGFVNLLTINGKEAGTNRLGEWQADGDSLVAHSRRGAVAYSFTTPMGDIYRLRVEGGPADPGGATRDFPLLISVDGVALARQVLRADESGSGAVEWWLPWLAAGPHTVRVFWDNAASYTSLRLTQVALLACLGADGDGDGVKDWVARRVRTESGFDLTNVVNASYTSPVCVEGRGAYPSAMRLVVAGAGGESRSLTFQAAPNGRWFANVPLPQDPVKRVTVEASFQNGAITTTRQFQWLPLDLLTAGNLMIRQGDSLLFTMGAAPQTDGKMTFTVGTNQLGDWGGMPVPHGFGEPGEFTVTGVWTPQRGPVQRRSITVKVVGFKFPPAPVCWVGRTRDWDVTNVPPEAVIEADERLLMTETAALADGGKRLELILPEAVSRPITVRLGATGPILSAVEANGIRVWGAGDTYCRVIETREDGSELVEMLLVQSPVSHETTLRLNVIVGGVLFDDGTTEKSLTARDFDALGQSRVRFICPKNAQTSVCHSITMLQGEAVVGRRQ